MTQSEKILIVSYKLGTANGVGGRRWLNYGLELIRQGYDVFFLTYQKNIPEELSELKHKVFQIKGNYPEILNSSPITFLEKIAYRFHLFILSRINKGNTFDTTIRTKKKFISAVVEIIRDQKISHIIISGAPFSLLYFGTIIKSKYPSIKLISDYRDAWTNGIGYGIPSLSRQKLNEELKYEKEVHRVSDKIIVASADIKRSLKEISNSIDPIVLPNFVDLSPFKREKIALQNCDKDKYICITHIGSVNQGTEIYWRHFLQKIEKFNQQSYKKIKCRFIGGQLPFLKSEMVEHQFSFMEFLPHMSVVQLGEYMEKTDLFVLFKNDKFPDSFPTKFFDYVCFRKPIVCYSIKGDVTNEIEQNELGLVCNEKTTQEQFNMHIVLLVNKAKFNGNYDYEKFMLPHLTMNLIQDVFSENFVKNIET
ncbi:MAG: glycosyltransferase [Bacteroidota bacterium]